MQAWKSSMSKEERSRLLHKAIELGAMGDKEGERKIIRQIPMKPSLADDIKRIEGLQFLIDGGYNLTDAINEFGEGWLHE